MTEELRVLVVDRVPLPQVSALEVEAPELRVSTLTPASVRQFEESGAWDSMAPPRSAAFRHMQVLAYMLQSKPESTFQGSLPNLTLPPHGRCEVVSTWSALARQV